MLDEKDLPLDLTPDLTPEDDLITDLPGEIEILESPDIPVVIDKEEEVGSEEHTSELQSHHDLVCRLLLEKKK